MSLANITLLKPFNIDTFASFEFGNISAGNVKTDHLLYSNGSPYLFTTNAAGSNTQVQFNDGNSFAGSANLTFDKSSNTLTVTYIVANGSGLTNLTGANVTGFVPNANIANTAYSVSASNISGTINLANYATTANSVAGANVSGFVANANVANTAYNVAGANVTGQVANALIATTITSSAQPNITSVGILTDLEVAGNTVIGGNLIVNGTTTTINSTVVSIDDLALVLANDATTASQANGAGIIINGASANMLYINSTNSFTFSHKISADGSLLSNIAGANVTGFVSNANVANTAYSVAGANVTGAVAYATTANAVAGANVSGFVPNANVANTAYSVSASNISGTINLANYATVANSVAGANVTGTVANATYSATAGAANSVAVANVSGIGNIATINLDGNASNILYGNGSFSGAPITYGNSNVAAYLPTYTGNLTPGNLTVTNTTNLGAVGNITITGGTSGQVLSTNGSGLLSWADPSSGGGSSPTTLNVDVFTGDGSTTAFTLTATPASINNVLVNYGGVLLPKDSYSVSGSTLTFTSAPANGAYIEVTIVESVGVVSSLVFTWQIISANATAVANKGYFVNTTGGLVELTLPVNGSLGDTVRVNDLAGNFGTNACRVKGNGNKIQGQTVDLLLDYNQAGIGLVYSNSTYGWKIMEFR